MNYRRPEKARASNTDGVTCNTTKSEIVPFKRYTKNMTAIYVPDILRIKLTSRLAAGGCPKMSLLTFQQVIFLSWYPFVVNARDY